MMLARCSISVAPHGTKALAAPVLGGQSPHIVLQPSITAPALHSAGGPQGASLFRAPTKQRQCQLLQPCRVTNTSSEIYRARGIPEPNAEEEEILVNEIQVHNPELGNLENRVQKQFLQELFQDSGVDLEETAYWFHTPPGGWKSELVTVRSAPEAPVTFPEPHHADAEAEDRIMFEDLEEGEVFTGVISDCWLYHGIQVDIGAEFDGLVPIAQDTWLEQPVDPNGRTVREALLPGDEVSVRVYKLRKPGLYRWPVQLELLTPEDIAARMEPPEVYQAPINHEWCTDQGWGPHEIAAASGRVFEPSNFFIGEDQAGMSIGMEMAYGYDDPESNFYLEHPMSDYLIGPGQVQIDDAMRGLGI